MVLPWTETIQDKLSTAILIKINLKVLVFINAYWTITWLKIGSMKIKIPLGESYHYISSKEHFSAVAGAVGKFPWHQDRFSQFPSKSLDVSLLQDQILTNWTDMQLQPFVLGKLLDTLWHRTKLSKNILYSWRMNRYKVESIPKRSLQIASLNYFRTYRNYINSWYVHVDFRFIISSSHFEQIVQCLLDILWSGEVAF